MCIKKFRLKAGVERRGVAFSGDCLECSFLLIAPTSFSFAAVKYAFIKIMTYLHIHILYVHTHVLIAFFDVVDVVGFFNVVEMLEALTVVVLLIFKWSTYLLI